MAGLVDIHCHGALGHEFGGDADGTRRAAAYHREARADHLVASVVSAWLMFRIIDPKLKALSVAFESDQAHYLDRVNKTTRWEESV